MLGLLQQESTDAIEVLEVHFIENLNIISGAYQIERIRITTELTYPQ